MLTVLGKPRDGDDFLLLFDRTDNRAGAAVCNHNVRPAHLRGVFLAVEELPERIVLGLIVGISGLRKDRIRTCLLLHQIVQRLQQAVELELLRAEGYKNLHVVLPVATG